jgi:hypothetical protein
MLNTAVPSNQPEMKRYRCAPHVKWAVERRGLTLVDAERGAFFCLCYPCAALWDLLTRGYRFEDAVSLTAQVAGMSVEATHKHVARLVEDWIALGLFLPEGEDG